MTNTVNYTEYERNSRPLTVNEQRELRQRRAYKRAAKKAKRQRKRLKIAIAFTVMIISMTGGIMAAKIVYGGGNSESAPSVRGITAFVSGEVRPVKPEAVGGGNFPNSKQSERFTELYYCEPDKLGRYAAYAAENPGLSAADVVWRVNANLDRPWYESDIPAASDGGPYIIVNKYYKVPDDYRPSDLVSEDGCEMRAETADAYREMKRAAAAEGFALRVVSAYRSVEYQRGLYNRYLSSDSKVNVDRYSARPGYSEHHTGMALDLFGSVDGLRNFVNTPEYGWVKENAYKYGFIIRYTAANEEITGYENEPWHIRYVGKPVSADMRKKKITSFEEYHVKYIEHRESEV